MRAPGAAIPVGTFWTVQVAPLSVERQTAPFQAPGAARHCSVPLDRNPITVEAQSVVVVVEPAVPGSIRILETAWESKGPPTVAPSCTQVAPPSAERRMPRP